MDEQANWRKCGALAFHFHSSELKPDDWEGEEWTEWRRIRATFWGQSKEGKFSSEDADKLFHLDEMPNHFRDLMDNWIPKRRTGKWKQKTSKSSKKIINIKVNRKP